MSKKLIAASDHLWYEIWMFCNLVRHLEADREIDQVSNNALVESFAIHTRILIDFFYCKGQLTAAQFFDPPDQWESLCPPKSELLHRAKTRADKEIAHLTYFRQKVRPEAKRWPGPALNKELRPLIDVFCENAPEIPSRSTMEAGSTAGGRRPERRPVSSRRYLNVVFTSAGDSPSLISIQETQNLIPVALRDESGTVGQHATLGRMAVQRDSQCGGGCWLGGSRSTCVLA